MKKSVNIKFLGFLAALFLCLSQVEAKDIYVSPNGASSGDGATVGAPVNLTRLLAILGSTISDNAVNVYFAGSTTTYDVTATSFSVINTSAYNGKTVTFVGTGTPSTPAIFSGGGTNNQMLSLSLARSSANAFSLTIRNIVMQNFSTTATNLNTPMLNVSGAYNTLNLDSVTIIGCNNPSTSTRLIYLDNANARLNITNSSIVNNTRGYRLIELSVGTAFLYNNTFSGNTVSGTNGGLYLSGSGTSNHFRIFNNTFYNTGNIYNSSTTSASADRMRIINNIVAGTSSIIGNGSSAIVSTNCFRNIIGTSFYESGNSGGTPLPTFGLDFSTSLTITDAPGKQVHQLQNPSNASHSIIRKGGSISSLSTETGGINLTHDQTGLLRPSNIALGAVEYSLYTFVRDSYIYLLENRYLGIPRPSSVTIDLPPTVIETSPNVGALTFELVNPTLPIGTLSPLTPDNKTTFTPAADVFTGTGKFIYNVKSGNTVVATGTILVILATLDTPGYTDPGDFNTCFAYMGAVDFTSGYRYRSQNVTGNGTGSHDRMYGFSIPLVGDLDGDGYPEIIGIGTDGGTTSGSYNSIHIYDGRSGRRMARLYLPGCSSSSGSYTHGQFHGSPSIMALVNSDPGVDNIVEVIVAFPNSGGDSNYRGKLASYNLVPTVVNGVTTTYTMNLRWGPVQYNLGGSSGTAAQSNYEKPVPTVVDIDGDGIPEVVAYNKIYNARTGALLTTLESLNSTAHVGADDGAYNYDDYVGFNYVYDMDLDGVYDVVGGGKVYQLAKSGASFSYTTIDANSISGVAVPDGRTGVADINGDGIPDVVNVTRADLTNSIANIRVVVWSPGFFQMSAYTPIGTPVLNSSGEFIRLTTPHPYIMADVTFNLYRDGGSGSNSYVFIGDIDGREQVVDGKTYRLPEIAILARQYTYGSLTRHPNIANISTANGGISSATSGTTGGIGVIAGLTWDANSAVTAANQKLKLSFLLEHNDRSNNTGFTMFDFDNDGKQEICYRDEQTLRIIKASRPYVPVSYTASDVVLFRETVNSYTGFEYPVIADIDNDASAEMVVMGHEDGAGDAWGYIYAVGNSTGGKFAPALPVWNQFMYDPFKINPDLTTPIGPAANRLSPTFTFRREIKDANNVVVETINEYRPFNGTLTQAPYYMGVETEPGELLNFEPIVFLTEAYIADNDDQVVAKRPQIDLSYIYITIGNGANAKTDVSPNTPIAIYGKNKVSKDNFVEKYTLAALYIESSPGVYTTTFGSNDPNTISAGQEYRFRIPINDPNDIYLIRLGDNSDTTPSTPIWRWGLNEDPSGVLGNPDQGIGQASRQFRDCDWQDQWVRVARYQTIDDAQTVQEFHSVEINVWDNDILPDAYFVNLHIPVVDSMTITRQPTAGYLTFSGSGRDSRITYHHDGRAPLLNAVDSFWYEVKFWDVTTNPHTRKTDASTVYIYVLESGTEGFSACYGSQVTITLANKPPGVSFNWFDNETGTHIGSGLTRTLLHPIEGDSTYQVQPSLHPDPYNVEFPKGLLTISLTTPDNSGNTTMRWTGAINQDWRNPYNWVEVRNGFEVPTRVAPSGCVDVILPTGAPNYPELTATASCHNIKLEDRAMIAQTRFLTYNNATVELKLSAAEKGRFVMWSAPLRSVYSGDYHFNNGSGPLWGDVYMNLFQQDNPDNSGSAVANMFTATFGKLDTELSLGRAFNLKVTPTQANKDSAFIFPQTATQYTYADDGDPSTPTTTPTLTRPYIGKFITEQGGINASFTMPVFGGNMGGRLVQVVNPFMAYLRVSEFLVANNLGNTYKVWSGLVDEDFIDILYTVDGQRLRINDTKGTLTTGNLTLIPPLQAFFVEKANELVSLPNVTMSHAWTTTKGGASSYSLLRSDAQSEERNLLRIKASQGSRVSSTLLCFEEGASPAYQGTEDSHKLFYSEIPLSVYSFTPSKEPLAINTNGNYTANTGLGLRTAEEGEVRLDFSGMATFGHKVYLIDYDRNGKVVETDLQTTPYYTFTAVKKSPSDAVIELNDRFALRMENTLTDVLPAGETLVWNVSEKAGIIHVRSTAPMSSLQVYAANGALVYQTSKASTTYEVRVARQQVYIVKAKIGETYKVQKIVVQ